MNPIINYRIMAPDLYRSLRAFTLALPTDQVPGQLLHLIDLRVSQINGCRFCLELHTEEARREGESLERIEALVHWRDSALFTDSERCAFEWADAMTRLDRDDHGRQDLITALREHFDDGAISRLTFAIAGINAWNRIAGAFHRHDGELADAPC